MWDLIVGLAQLLALGVIVLFVVGYAVHAAARGRRLEDPSFREDDAAAKGEDT